MPYPNYSLDTYTGSGEDSLLHVIPTGERCRKTYIAVRLTTLTGTLPTFKVRLLSYALSEGGTEFGISPTWTAANAIKFEIENPPPDLRIRVIRGGTITAYTYSIRVWNIYDD